jgi:hypothetical protein
MKQLLALFLIVALLLLCGAGAILLVRGWFTLRTSSSVPAAPTVVIVPAAATPTLAALPPAQGADPGSGGDSGAPPVNAQSGFNGSFSGTLSGDNGSSAPATLVLSQNGDAVTGQLDIGSGLALDAGNCGLQAVPAGSQTAAGTLDPAAPNHLETTGSIGVSGFTITVRLAADLASDGQSLTARADLDLPLLCGQDAAINGVFSRN